MSIEAMKQALEALANSRDYIYLSPTGDCTWSEQDQLSELKEAITALRQAIEQAEQYNATSDHCLMENAQGDLERIKLVQTGVGIGKPEQEPVAWFHTATNQAFTSEPPPSLKAQCKVLVFADASPPTRQPLTDEQKDAARWRWLSEHIQVAWDEGKFTSLVRIVSDQNRQDLNASIDRMMAGDWSDATAKHGIKE